MVCKRGAWPGAASGPPPRTPPGSVARRRPTIFPVRSNGGPSSMRSSVRSDLGASRGRPRAAPSRARRSSSPRIEPKRVAARHGTTPVDALDGDATRVPRRAGRRRATAGPRGDRRRSPRDRAGPRGAAVRGALVAPFRTAAMVHAGARARTSGSDGAPDVRFSAVSGSSPAPCRPGRARDADRRLADERPRRAKCVGRARPLRAVRVGAGGLPAPRSAPRSNRGLGASRRRPTRPRRTKSPPPLPTGGRRATTSRERLGRRGGRAWWRAGTVLVAGESPSLRSGAPREPALDRLPPRTTGAARRARPRGRDAAIPRGPFATDGLGRPSGRPGSAGATSSRPRTCAASSDGFVSAARSRHSRRRVTLDHRVRLFLRA